MAIAQSCPNITITPSFDSECIITEFGRKPPEKLLDRALIDETKCNTVCKNSTIRVDNLSLSPGVLQLTDAETNCHRVDCDVEIPMFDWRQCESDDTCSFGRTQIHRDIWQSPVRIYFLFTFELPYNSSLISFWAEPDFSISYTYNYPNINGNFSFEIQLLREWNAQGIEICFFAEIAIGQRTCLIKLCFPAQYFLDYTKKNKNLKKSILKSK
jgi:hypothetical protein